MASKKCAICGEYSGMYPLCKFHNELKETGIVYKDNLGQWKLKEKENVKCLLCNKLTKNNNLFCKDCYQLIKKERNNFNHNREQIKIYEHYFNLKNSLYDSKTDVEFNEKIILMWALAEEYENIYDKIYLLDRVKFDILNELDKFKNKTNTDNNDAFNDEDFRERWPREHQCEDGHYVRSLSEMLIDNWLYNHDYVHAYEKSVFMESNPEAVVLSDFYLKNKNVYIEYWGLEDNEKYLKRKEEKIKLYDENNYNRIDLSEKDIKRLDDIMPRLLSKFKK